MSLAPWPVPEAFPPLDAREVQVWRAPLAPGPEALARLEATLSNAERERADRFHFERDRTAYVAARGALRTLLGRHLGVSPAEVPLTADAHGKPHLDLTPGPHFNLSHAGAWALVALHPTRRLGVDLEPLRDVPDLACMVPMVFGAGERGRLDAVPPHERLDTFFAAWTRKEAVVKALGLGLSYGVERVTVAWAAGEPVGPVHLDGALSPEWAIADLSFPGYRAALAIEGPVPAIRRWSLAP